METYSFGDWVVYDPGYKDPEIGRVTEDKGDSAFVRTTRECAVCGRPFEVPGKSRKVTCSDACAKVRKRERELAWKAATRNGCEL